VKRKSGFTLIELVVVMAIVAVLASLMVAAIMAARRQATNTQRSGNAKTLELALETYASTHNNKYPTYCSSGCNVSNVRAETATTGLQAFLRGAGSLSSDLQNLAFTAYNSDSTGSNYTLFACDANTQLLDTGKLPTAGQTTSTLGEACRIDTATATSKVYVTAR